MSWRPDNWKNTQAAFIKEVYADWDHIRARTGHGVDGEISERSADVILDALIKNGYVTSEALRNVKGAPGWKNLKDGKWYFIPD